MTDIAKNTDSRVLVLAPGDWMHIHNITSDYIPTYTLDEGHQFFKEH